MEGQRLGSIRNIVQAAETKKHSVAKLRSLVSFEEESAPASEQSPTKKHSARLRSLTSFEEELAPPGEQSPRGPDGPSVGPMWLKL